MPILALMGIGAEIKKRRIELGLTQPDLARAVGVTKSAVGQWEREGGTVPTGPNLVKVAEALGTTPESLAGKSKRLGRQPEPTIPLNAGELSDREIAIILAERLPLSRRLDEKQYRAFVDEAEQLVRRFRPR